MKIHNRDLKIEKQGLIFKSVVKLTHDEKELMLYQDVGIKLRSWSTNT